MNLQTFEIDCKKRSRSIIFEGIYSSISRFGCPYVLDYTYVFITIMYTFLPFTF